MRIRSIAEGENNIEYNIMLVVLKRKKKVDYHFYFIQRLLTISVAHKITKNVTKNQFNIKWIETNINFSFLSHKRKCFYGLKQIQFTLIFMP